MIEKIKVVANVFCSGKIMGDGGALSKSREGKILVKIMLMYDDLFVEANTGGSR